MHRAAVPFAALAVLSTILVAPAALAAPPSGVGATARAATPVSAKPYLLTAEQLHLGNAEYGRTPAIAFDSPSRNIQCFAALEYGKPDYIGYTCQLHRWTYRVTKPSWENCEGAVITGAAITTVQAFRPEFVCWPAGEPIGSFVPQRADANGRRALARARILPIGASVTLRDTTCTMTSVAGRETVSCSRHGAGFVLSSVAYRLHGPSRG